MIGVIRQPNKVTGEMINSTVEFGKEVTGVVPKVPFNHSYGLYHQAHGFAQGCRSTLYGSRGRGGCGVGFRGGRGGGGLLGIGAVRSRASLAALPE